MKRCIDLLIALAGVLALWPVLLFIAALIRRDSPGPALYTQTRVGLGGRPFRIFKFRSMVIDGHKVGPPTTSADDPRITRIGRLLRKTSLASLPCNRHSQIMGDSASSANDTVKSWFLGQA